MGPHSQLSKSCPFFLCCMYFFSIGGDIFFYGKRSLACFDPESKKGETTTKWQLHVLEPFFCGRVRVVATECRGDRLTCPPSYVTCHGAMEKSNVRRIAGLECRSTFIDVPLLRWKFYALLAETVENLLLLIKHEFRQRWNATTAQIATHITQRCTSF